MEQAKKLLLVEPRLLEQLQVHNQYKELQKPADKKAKTALSMQLQNILDDEDLPEDIKVRNYQQVLNKYLTIRDIIPPHVEAKVNWEAREEDLQPPAPFLFPSPPLTRQAAARKKIRVSPVLSAKKKYKKAKPSKTPPLHWEAY